MIVFRCVVSVEDYNKVRKWKGYDDNFKMILLWGIEIVYVMNVCFKYVWFNWILSDNFIGFSGWFWVDVLLFLFLMWYKNIRDFYLK